MISTIKQYNTIKIPKTKKSFRTIYIPSADYKAALQSKIPYLENLLQERRKNTFSYAFERGKNCALNALQHVSFRYTLSLDIEDFFDSIKECHVEKYLDEEFIALCFIKGSPKQGLPTSPIVSNIAFIDIDEKINREASKICSDFTYTRYADDMFFSFNSPRDAFKIKHIVAQILDENGFRLNSRKTSLQDAKGGRRIITGVAVSGTGIHATRKTKKRSGQLYIRKIRNPT